MTLWPIKNGKRPKNLFVWQEILFFCHSYLNFFPGIVEKCSFFA